jgi:hypothetical protein
MILIDFWLIAMLIGIPTILFLIIVKLATSAHRDVNPPPRPPTYIYPPQYPPPPPPPPPTIAQPDDWR